MAHIKLDWVVSEFFEPDSADCHLNDLFFRFVKNKKQVVFKLPNQSEFVLWRNLLRKICIQTDFNDTFKVESLISKSLFSNVYIVRSLVSEKIFACKRFRKKSMKEESYFRSMINEIEILKKLRTFPFFSYLREVHETTNSIYVVTDFYPGGNVFKRGVGYSVSEIMPIASQIADALRILKKLNIIHRDLKPSNIMLEYSDKSLEENRIRIIDFGLSFFSEDEDIVFRGSGTPYYMPPNYRNNLLVIPNHKFDIYSVGVMLINALLGEKLNVVNYQNENEQNFLVREAQFTKLQERTKPKCKLNSVFSSEKHD